MIKYEITANGVQLVRQPEGSIKSKLPALIYTARVDEQKNLYLERFAEKFSMPEKVYGSTPTKAARIFSTYTMAKEPIGAAAVGGKGLGKSDLMKLTANTALDAGIPVIRIDSALAGSQFDSFLSDLGEVVVMFDEFAKTYSAPNPLEPEAKDSRNATYLQERLLSLLDGTVPGKRLILITENFKSDLSNLFIDRPSRLLYLFEYDHLEDTVIQQYTKEFKLKKPIRKELLELARTTRRFNFDMLKQIVAEHLRYNEPIADFIEFMNIETAPSTVQILTITKAVYKRTEGLVIKPNQEVPFNLNEGFDVMYTNPNATSQHYKEGAFEVYAGDRIYYDGVNIAYEDNDYAVTGTIKTIELDKQSPRKKGFQ